MKTPCDAVVAGASALQNLGVLQNPKFPVTRLSRDFDDKRLQQEAGNDSGQQNGTGQVRHC